MKSKNRENFGKGKEIKIEPEVPKPQPQISNFDADDSIEAMFRNEQNANQDNVKELFHEQKVKARTDISARQVKLITKAFYLAKITGMREINDILSDFLTLNISKDRKSRAEYVEGLKAKIDNQIQQGMMNIRGQFGK